MRGIILAGGSGTRLHPLTLAVSKQLLPVYNKPMIYYPLSTLMLAGIREIMIITTEKDKQQFVNLLGDGSNLGVKISFRVQSEPKGIADGLLIAHDFIENSNICVALGDNIFYGSGVGEMLAGYEKDFGATILAQKVHDPSRYGVVEISAEGKAVSLVEKPAKPVSPYAVPGLYFYDSTALERTRLLKPSARGELEITDLNQSYLADGMLSVKVLPRGTAWLDTGTIESLNQASEFVKVVEERQGFMIGCPEEIAWRLGYINSENIMAAGERLSGGTYGKYLLSLLQ